MSKKMHSIIIRASGAHEEFVGTFNEIKRHCGWDVADTVRLPNGQVMLVDDEGYLKETSVPNADATKIYWSVCKPGTTHQILNDVALVADKDFE